MVAWTTTALVADQLGPGAGEAFLASPVAQRAVNAANANAWRKRALAGYVDPAGDTDTAPDDAIEYVTTLWAASFWRERGQTGGFSEFEDIASYQPTGTTWTTIKRGLGIPRAGVDGPLSASPAALRYATWRTR